MINKEETLIEWDKPKEWTKTIQKLSDIDTKELLNIHDVNEWSPNKNIDNQIFKTLLKSCKNIYIQGYHACRPIDLNDYYRDGFIVPDKNTYLKLLDKYCDNLDIKITQNDYLFLKEEINNIELENGIFFCITKSEILKNSPHYLIYGSEELFSLFGKVYNLRVYDLLEDAIGVQTIFKANIPFDFLNEYWQKELTLVILKNWISYSKDSTIQSDPAIKINKNLPSKYIVNHFHPKQAPNYHKQGTITKFKYQDNQVIK